MKVLVTGAAGFIGSHAVDRLLSDGHDVHGVDDLSTGSMANLASAATHSRFVLTQTDIVEPALDEVVARARPDAVLHLAAQMDVRRSVADPLFDARVNVLGSIRVLAAAAACSVQRVVFASSGGTVYGEPGPEPVLETAALRPLSPYGAAKVAGEAYTAAFAALHGMRYCVLALGNVYGPRQDPHGEAGVVSIFAQAMLSGQATRIFGDGSAVRDYVHVADVVDAVVRALAGRGDGERLNVGTGRGTSVKDLHRLLAGLTGAPDTPEHLPSRAGELRHVVLCPDKARKHLDWSPTTGLEAGLRATVAWLAERRSGRTPL